MKTQHQVTLSPQLRRCDIEAVTTQKYLNKDLFPKPT